MSNSPPLKTLIHQLWKPNFERQGISPTFKPFFVAYIGVEEQREYNNVLATLQDKAEKDARHTVVFDNTIPFEVDFDFMNSIKSELQFMDVFHLKNEDLVMFPEDVNPLFVEKLQEVILLAVQNEHFSNDSVRNNFITKLLLHVYNHIRPLEIVDLSLSKTNKCIYYGEIEKHDMYLLILLAKMNWDVIYINPLKEPFDLTFSGIEKHLNKQILPIESLRERSSQGTVYERFDSITLGFEEEMEQSLFTDSGLFRPWQFKKGTTKNLFFNSTIIDLENNWNEEARVRQGFDVDGKIVKIPNFFYELEGEYEDTSKYKELVNKLVQAKNVLFSTGKVSDFLDISISEEQVLQITFCQLNDGTFDLERLKELPFYNYAPFNDDTENFILEKINETLQDRYLFSQPLATKTDILEFVGACLELNKKVIRLIDSFDFPFSIPKIVIFLDNESSVEPQVPYLLGFLHKIGFDIAVFSPAGMSDLSGYIERGRFNCQRLETIKYDRSFSSLGSIASRKASHKEGFFSKLFG